MFLAPDDAKTDVILVGAVFVFGGTVQRLASSLPGYPTQGIAGRIVQLLWIVVLTGLVPALLARHRGDRLAAFGLDGPRASVVPGLLLAIPVLAAGVLRGVVPGGSTDIVLAGRLGRALLPAAGPDPLMFLLVVLELLALSLGVLLVISFLAVRAREGFPRSPDLPLTQLIRLVGAIAVGAAVVLGLLNAVRLRSAGSAIEILIEVVAIGALLALVDRHVPPNLVVPRTTVIAPVVVVTIAHVIAAGGLFFGDLLGGLLTAALAMGVTVAIAALAQTRTRTWAAIPLALATHWWIASPLSPLA